MEPEHLVVARNSDEHIPYHSGLYTIHAEARSVVESWYLQIKVDSLQYVSGAQALLRGMAGSNFIATDTRVDVPKNIDVVTGEVKPADGSISADGNTTTNDQR